MKKITILTHRLGSNYGGILQAYALQRCIKSVAPGEVYVSTIDMEPRPGLFRRIVSTIKAFIIGRRPYVNSIWVQSQIQKDTLIFLSKYVNRVESLNAGRHLCIVGSDQVWRAAYVDPVKYMFGSINDDSVQRISYAASFGTDDLSEYTEDQIRKTAELAKKFSGISVREDSGVEIVKKYWGLRAEHHIDPTLLLSSKDYSKLINDEPTKPLEGTLFAYVLDRSPKNNAIINKIEALSATKQFELMPNKYISLADFLRNKEAYLMPKVEQWLRSFRDADYVVTDSFHGTVFSIIFNKPFITIGNKDRGLARFSSLLSIFGFEERLVEAIDDVTSELVNQRINWKKVNAKIKSEEKHSLDYLKKYLG